MGMAPQNSLMVLTLVLATAASAQGSREKFKENFLKNSPCGADVKPVSCTCKSGEEFTIGEGKPACRPKEWESCTCPSGDCSGGCRGGYQGFQAGDEEGVVSREIAMWRWCRAYRVF